MGKSMFSAAAAVLALSGAATAFPQFSVSNITSVAGATGATSSVASSTVALNTTTSASSTSSSASSTSTNIKYCPNLDGEIVVGPLDIQYEISCDTNHVGVIIDITFAKRATPDSLTDCLAQCSQLDDCIAASYDTNNPTCYLFSSVGAAISSDGFQFAEKASALASSTTASATAVVTGSTAGSTASANSTTSGNSTSPVENLFCPQLDGQVYKDGNGASYIIECSNNHVGVVIGVGAAKRAVATSIVDCLSQCDATDGCVGTGYNTAAATCTLFSTVGAVYYDANVDFAMRVADGTTPGSIASSAAAGSDIITATVYTTTTSTVLSCAATVTDCPLRGSVVTDLVVAYTTVCPASDLPAGAITTAGNVAAPIACTACPYAAVTATVYSTTVSTILSCGATVTNCPLTAGATAATITSMVAVATSVVNYPLPQTTVVSTSKAVVPVGPSATTSGLASFTGAANALNAGMGMAGAIVAGAAFLL